MSAPAATSEEVLAGLARVREAILEDRKKMEAVVAERDALKAEVEALKGNGAQGVGAEEIAALKAENAELKAKVERLEYRILHLCRSLDTLNAQCGRPVIPIVKKE